MKVIVNRDNCIGCGACAGICPKVFQIDDEDGLSTVICDDFSNVDEASLNDAIEGCPTLAIEKVEEKS